MNLYTGFRISGSTRDVVLEYVRRLNRELSDYYHILSPMTGKLEMRTDPKYKAEGYAGNPLSHNHAIFERDMWMVGQCDIFYLNLINGFDADTPVTIGGIMELAVASYLRKHTIVSMLPDSVHRHAFIIEAADVIFESHESAINYLNTLAINGHQFEGEE